MDETIEHEYVLSIFCRNDINDCLRTTLNVVRSFVEYKSGKYKYQVQSASETNTFELRLSTNAFTRNLLPIIHHSETPFKLAVLTSAHAPAVPISIELYVNVIKFKELRNISGNMPVQAGVQGAWEKTVMYALDRHISSVYVSPPTSKPLTWLEVVGPSATAGSVDGEPLVYPSPLSPVTLAAPTRVPVVLEPPAKRRRVVTPAILRSSESKWQEIAIQCSHPIGSSGYSFYFPPRYTMRIARTCGVPCQHISIRGRVLCGAGLARNDLVVKLIQTLKIAKQEGVGPLGDRRVCGDVIVCHWYKAV